MCLWENIRQNCLGVWRKTENGFKRRNTDLQKYEYAEYYNNILKKNTRNIQ